MKRHTTTNYLKVHRKKSGLSQREIAGLIGYRDPGQISRHERSESVPSLRAAIYYEVVFRAPLSTIFVGMHADIRQEIETKLQRLEAELQSRSAKDPDANVVAQKLVWLHERKQR